MPELPVSKRPKLNRNGFPQNEELTKLIRAI